MTPLTSVVRQSVSIDSGLMNLAFVHGPAARDPRHSTAQSTRQTSLGPGSRPPSSNNASFAERFRACADGNMETQRLRAIQHPNRATTLLESWASTLRPSHLVRCRSTISGTGARAKEARVADQDLQRVRRNDGRCSLCAHTGSRMAAMRMMMRMSAPPEGKTEAIALLSWMQSSLSEWLSMPPALEQYPVSCPVWRAQLYEAACRARSAGLHAYSSLSLRIGKQLEPSFRSNDLPRWAVELLLRWSHASLRYLRHTAEFRSAAELVGLLSMSRSPDYYGAEERACLLRNLIQDHESDSQRCARQAVEPRSRSAGTS